MSSSSSSTVSATTVNGVTRFSGLSSGIDVDSLVKKLIDADSGTLNKLKQEKQIDTWKQEQYRTLITDLQTFTNKYLDLSSADSILKQSNFQQFSVTSDSSAVTATAGGTATKGSHTISVSQLATAAKVSSASGMTQDVTGSTAPDYASLNGTSFTIKVDGATRTVTFDSAYDSSSQTGVEYVQAAINKAIGTTTSGASTINKVTVALDSNGYLTFTPTANSGVNSITISEASSSGAFSALGFSSSSNLSNRISTSDTLSAIAGKLKSADAFSFDASGEISFSINGKSFTFDQSDTLSDVISTVNNDTDANVTMKYDQNADQLVIVSKEMGAGNTLTLSDNSGTFVSKLLTTTTPGQDAQVVLDGQSLTRSSNSITQDGVTYNLQTVTSTTANIDVEQDVDGIYDKINNFVTAYNALLDEINGKLSETYDRDYAPLTDAQQSSMSDAEITNWNKKAQTGLLEHDSALQNLVYNMRNALMSSVSGQSETLTKLGITTSTYTEKGKLHVDESTLKAAISDDPEGVMALFTQSSKSYSGTITVRTLSSSQRSTRTSEEGLAYKLYDIIQDNIGTVRDSGGNKGLLIEKAGITDDASDSTNSLSKDLDTLADKITAEQNRLNTEEDRYYTQFTNMETILEQLSSQSSIITSFASS